MAHGHIKEFDSTKETIDDFRQRFEFYCAANNMRSEDETQQARKKALFITMLWQITFIKLRDLANPTDITTLSLDQVVELLTAHYHPQTIKITECYKFFKRTQEDQERTTDFIAALRRLVKTCNFGQYLDTAFHDQFVCGLNDRKCQWELLSTQELTLQMAIQKATAAKIAIRESWKIHGASAEQMASKDLHKILPKLNAFAVVGLATNQHSASIKLLNVTIAKRLDIWLQCVAQSNLLTDKTRILPVVSVFSLCKKLLTVMMTTVVIALDTCIIFYRWALKQTSSYSQWISTQYQLR